MDEVSVAAFCHRNRAVAVIVEPDHDCKGCGLSVISSLFPGRDRLIILEFSHKRHHWDLRRDLSQTRNAYVTDVLRKQNRACSLLQPVVLESNTVVPSIMTHTFACHFTIGTFVSTYV